MYRYPSSPKLILPALWLELGWVTVSRTSSLFGSATSGLPLTEKRERRVRRTAEVVLVYCR
jgi:hypothetical protein